MSDMKVTPELLKKYGAGNCTPDERQLVEDWLDGESEVGSYDLMAGTEEAHEKRLLDEVVDKHLAKKNRRYLLRPVPVAALWLVLTMAGFFIYRAMRQAGGSPPHYQAITVPYGKKVTVLLPDGSTAYVNSGSKLTYPKSFSGPERLLTLEGEAFFEVVKQEGKPFVVEAHGTRTEVLGTKFNLNSFAAAERTVLTVAEGKVMLTANYCRDTLVIGANKGATYQYGRLLPQAGIVRGSGDWKNGRIRFDNHTIAEIKPVLERWFNVSITVADPKINSYKMRGRYRHPSLRQVLEDLSYTTGISYHVEGRNVTIYP